MSLYCLSVCAVNVVVAAWVLRPNSPETQVACPRLLSETLEFSGEAPFPSGNHNKFLNRSTFLSPPNKKGTNNEI